MEKRIKNQNQSNPGILLKFTFLKKNPKKTGNKE